MLFIRQILNSNYCFWLLLTIPSWELIAEVFLNERYYAEIMYESGTWSVILMIFALAITPLMRITGNWRPVFWLQKRRRAIGVASFGYAALHTFFYIRQTGTFELVVLETFDAAFLLGWLAFLVITVLAITSNAWAMKTLGRYWKPLQRLSYAALALSLLHWLWIDQFVSELIYWVSAILMLQLARIMLSRFKASRTVPTKSLLR